MKVLVTGGTGYLGSRDRARARRAAGTSRSCSRVTRSAQRTAPGARIDGDVRDTRAVTAAAAGVDAICHAAALVASGAARPDGVRRRQRRRAADRRRCLRRAGTRAPRLHLVVSRAAAGRAHHSRSTANDYQRTKVRARDVAARRGRDGSRSSRWSRRRSTARAPRPKATWSAAWCATTSPAGCRASSARIALWSFAFVDDVADAHVAALSTRARRGIRRRRRERAADAGSSSSCASCTGTPLPRRIPVTRPRRRWPRCQSLRGTGRTAGSPAAVSRFSGTTGHSTVRRSLQKLGYRISPRQRPFKACSAGDLELCHSGVIIARIGGALRRCITENSHVRATQIIISRTGLSILWLGDGSQRMRDRKAVSRRCTPRLGVMRGILRAEADGVPASGRLDDVPKSSGSPSTNRRLSPSRLRLTRAATTPV